MADFTSSPGTGDSAIDGDASHGAPDTSTSHSNPLTRLTNISGAVVSLALVAGIGVWGYKLLVRDVSGIPVVRAVAGEMRVRPEDPGGQQALNQGLSVNTVAAVGSAGKPADRLKLAPKPIELTSEDQPVTVAMVTDVPQAARPAAATEAAEASAEGSGPLIDVSAALQSENVNELVAQLTAGVAPMEPLSDEGEADMDDDIAGIVENVSEGIVEQVAAAEADAEGLRRSLRPRNRPAGGATLVQAALNTGEDASSGAETAELDAATLPAGTRLVQLGAFDSPEIARAQWDGLQGRFSAYLAGKSRVVQKATSGGRVFYRLRAHGFEDIADARRFCSVLVADNADCIPVVTR